MPSPRTPTVPSLAYFTRLSPSVYYLPRPSASPSPSSSAPTATPSAASTPATIPPPGPAPTPNPTTAPAPRLILLATWMGALPPHMDKYIEPYRAQWPSSPILVVRSEAADWLVPWHKPDVSAAASVVRSLFPELDAERAIDDAASAVSAVSSASTSGASTTASSLVPSKSSTPAPATPSLLIHIWSNGGSASLARLRQALAPATLPPFTLVLDSTPGQFTYSGTLTAFTLVTPPRLRLLLKPFLHGMVAWFWLLTFLRSRLDLRRRRRLAAVGAKPVKGGPLALLAASHNDPRLRPAEVRRTYVYSKEDHLIPIKDVQEHAEEARERGFRVREEEFSGSAHVAHARLDPGRYWRVARETWEGAKGAQAEAVEEVGEEKEGIEAQQDAVAA